MKYDFGDRLTKEFPSQIIVDASEVCNLGCIHCPHPTFKKSEHYSAKFLDPELNKKMIDEVATFGYKKTQYVRYTSNGEPLTHPKIFEMMKYAKDFSKVTVALTSNGKLFTDRNIEKLIETQVDLIDISIDALEPETYKKIRIGGDLTVLTASLRKLISEKNRRKLPMKIVTSYVEQDLNKTETAGFEAFWKNEGVDYVVIRRLHSAAGCNPTIAAEMHSNLKNAKRKPCVYPWERIVLSPTGKLAFCPADWTHGSTFADYNTTTIHEAWQGQFMIELREAHLKNDFAKHKFCGQCPDWSAVRWPNEGRAYADMVEEFKREGADINSIA